MIIRFQHPRNHANFPLKLAMWGVLGIALRTRRFFDPSPDIPPFTPTTSNVITASLTQFLARYPHSSFSLNGSKKCPSYRDFLRYVQILARWVRVSDVVRVA